jgi:CheY-like chemotaxis protein
MKRPSVLVVDDDPTIRGAVVVTLQSRGYEVREAGDGCEAMDRVREGIPALILLDIMMPCLDGWEVKQRLNHDPVTATVPVVSMTALANSDAYDRAGELGFVAHLEKPFRFDQLIAVVEGSIRPA